MSQLHPLAVLFAGHGLKEQGPRETHSVEADESPAPRMDFAQELADPPDLLVGIAAPSGPLAARFPERAAQDRLMDPPLEYCRQGGSIPWRNQRSAGRIHHFGNPALIGRDHGETGRHGFDIN